MKSKRASSSLDIIPENILESILCLLPTKEAARTSILSRKWRYKWTKIPKLEFDVFERIIPKEKQVQGKTYKPLYDLLHQVLLLHQGLIHEFSLTMFQPIADEDPFGFDQILLHLSKNHTVKKLQLHAMYTWQNLPISIFSMHHLTDLDISRFDLDHQPTLFNGFGSLRSLILDQVGITTETLLHLLSNCPSLKHLTLYIDESHLGGKDCTVIELFKSLPPMIEHLTTFGDVFEWLVLEQKRTTLLLVHLKSFCFEQMCFVDGYGLAFLLVLIKCSPNLEKIKLQIVRNHRCYQEYFVVWEYYSDVRLEHLNELEMEGFTSTEPEMEFVKFILSRSPNLKKVSISQNPEIIKTLLHFSGNTNCQVRVTPKPFRRALTFV